MVRQATKSLDQVEQTLDVKQEDKRKETKELEIRRAPDGLYYVAFTAGGEVPDMLKGKWTGFARAQAAIENYNQVKAQKAAA